MFEELCKFFTIYQRIPDENWKCIKFERGLKADILASVGPMERRDFVALANKSQLVEKYNKKLADTKLDAYGKRLAPENQEFQHIPPPKKPFQPSGNEGKQPQRSLMKQECSKCGKYHGGKPCFVGQNVCFSCEKPGHFVKECPRRY